jgi:hypothetical protein
VCSQNPPGGQLRSIATLHFLSSSRVSCHCREEGGAADADALACGAVALVFGDGSCGGRGGLSCTVSSHAKDAAAEAAATVTMNGFANERRGTCAGMYFFYQRNARCGHPTTREIR